MNDELVGSMTSRVEMVNIDGFVQKAWRTGRQYDPPSTKLCIW